MTTPQIHFDDDKPPVSDGWIQIALTGAIVVVIAVALIVGLSGCMAAQKADDPLTKFDESTEETVGIPLWDQPAGTGAPLGGDEGDEGGLPGWAQILIELGTSIAIGMPLGNAAMAIALRRGKSNLTNIFARSSPGSSKAASVAAVFLPTDSPPEAKAITVEVTKEKAQAEVNAAKGGK